VNEEPLPFVQEDPEFTEYCHVAFVSSPATLIAPFVVMPSELDDPVSLAIDKIGAEGDASGHSAFSYSTIKL